MKKYTLFSFIFILSLILLGFNAKPASAYDSGCIGNGLYSITTGQLCSTSQVSYNNYGCTSAGPYNTITGQFCNGSSVVNNFIAGCTGTTAYSVITGQSCYGSQTNYSNIVSGQELQLGSTGSDVTALQQSLKAKGYFTNRIDGVFGTNTRVAVARYQVDNNLSPTGIADVATLASLNISSKIPIPCPFVYGGTYNYACPPVSNLQAPTISGVNGPQSLSVNQQGTWTVTAYNQNFGNLSYSVVWGDENIYPYLTANSLRSPLSQQSATFTHSYLQAGTYTPVFTVTNNVGQTAQTSLSVNVGGLTTGNTPTISSLTPSYGVVGSQVTIYGTNLGSNGCTTIYCTGLYSVNTVHFGSSATISNVASSNGGSTLTFTVPYSNDSPCGGCMATAIVPGVYNVYVTNSNGTSNSVIFTVTSSSTTNSLQIVSANPLPIGQIGTNYYATISGSGGTGSYTWSLVPNTYNTYLCLGGVSCGTLPPGLLLSQNPLNCFTFPCSNQNPVVISGIPTAAGSYTFGLRLTDASGTSTTQTFSLTVGNTVSNQYLSINYLSQTSGFIGNTVTIYGTGFATSNPGYCTGSYCVNSISQIPNTVNFGSNVIRNLYSANGTSLTFTVPSYTSPACLYSIPSCYVSQSQITPGIYPISVTNASGTSNAINFTVTY